MTSDTKPGAARARQSADRRRLAAISPLPAPEDVFVDWLLSVPHGASLEDAARRQVALIDQRASVHPDLLCLRTLLAAVAGGQSGLNDR